MYFRLTRNCERRARTGYYQPVTSQDERCAIFLRVAVQAPLLLIKGCLNAPHLAYTQLQLNLFSNPSKILRPLAMCGPRASAVDPIGIAQLVDEETLPGEVNHLFGDCAAQLLIFPTGGEVRKTNVLLRARSQQLMAIGESCSACPVGCHALPVNNPQVRRGISQL